MSLPAGRCLCPTPVLMYSAHNLWTRRRVTRISRATVPASLPFFISRIMYRMDLSVSFGDNVSLDLCSLKYSSQVRLIVFKRHDSWIIHNLDPCKNYNSLFGPEMPVTYEKAQSLYRERHGKAVKTCWIADVLEKCLQFAQFAKNHGNAIPHAGFIMAKKARLSKNSTRMNHEDHR